MDNDWTRGSGAGNDQIHANDMFYLNGDFHLYWSVNYWGRTSMPFTLYMRRAKMPWALTQSRTRRHGWITVSTPKFSGDDDGQLYMYMVRFTDGNTIWGRKMKNPAEFAGEPVCQFASLPDTWGNDG